MQDYFIKFATGYDQVFKLRLLKKKAQKRKMVWEIIILHFLYNTSSPQRDYVNIAYLQWILMSASLIEATKWQVW